MSTGLPWFRMYAEAVHDTKLRLLSFEDRWHFVALLCCKCDGTLDQGELLRRRLSVALGLAPRELDAMALRLAEVGLIDYETFQPAAWDERQFKSDSSTGRVKAYRERMKRSGNVSVTAQEEDTDTESLSDTSPPPPASPVVGSFEGHDANPRPSTPNPAAPLAIALNKAQFKCTSYTPALTAYVGEGGTLEHLLQVLAVHGADCSGKPAAYLLGIARRELTERANPVTPVAGSRYVAPPPARTTETVEQTRAKLEATKPSKPADPEAAQRAIEEARRFLAMPEPATRDAPPRVSAEEKAAALRELEQRKGAIA